eukprot:scaffold6103_cov65-Phaeocystis_antarctica.AAC.3
MFIRSPPPHKLRRRDHGRRGGAWLRAGGRPTQLAGGHDGAGRRLGRLPHAQARAHRPRHHAVPHAELHRGPDDPLPPQGLPGPGIHPHRHRHLVHRRAEEGCGRRMRNCAEEGGCQEGAMTAAVFKRPSAVAQQEAALRCCSRATRDRAGLRPECEPRTRPSLPMRMPHCVTCVLCSSPFSACCRPRVSIRPCTPVSSRHGMLSHRPHAEKYSRL